MNWMNEMHWWKRILFVLGALVFAALMALLFGWLLMLLWNWLMPQIFGLPLITYWQGWGLILLSHLLFKGAHAGPGHPRRSFYDGSRRRGGYNKGRFHRRPDQEDFNEFKREFHHRMRQRWHDSDHMSEGREEAEEKETDLE